MEEAKIKDDGKDLNKKDIEGADGKTEGDGKPPEVSNVESTDDKKDIEVKEPIESKEGKVSEASEEVGLQEKEKDLRQPAEDKTSTKASEKSLEDREKELSKREEELSKREIEAGAKSILRDKGLSEDVLPLVIRGSLEDTEASIELLEKVLGDQVEKKLGEVAKSKSPEDSKGNINKGTGSMADIIEAGLRG